MSEGPTSLQEFVKHSVWPYVVFYLMYVLLKYTGLVLALCIICYKKRQKKTGDANFIGSRARSHIISHVSRFVHLTIGVLPDKLTMSDEYADDESPTVYMNGETEMEEEHIMILAVHCISLITIALLIATKMFWMNIITHGTCVTGGDVHCFPQILNERDSHLADNISLEARISDCTMWTGGSFKERITFLCFEFTYSLEGAIVAVGGVASLFKPTMNIIISVATKIYKRAKKCKCACNKIIYVVQIIIGWFVFVPIELILVIGVLVSAGSATCMQDEFFMNTLAEKVVMFFISHGFVVVFIFGIIHTSFFIPWDLYTNN